MAFLFKLEERLPRPRRSRRPSLTGARATQSRWGGGHCALFSHSR